MRPENGRLAGAAPPDRKYTHSFLAILLPVLYCIIDALGTICGRPLLYEYDDDGTIVSGVIAEGPANIAYELTFLLIAVFAFIYVVIIKKRACPFAMRCRRSAARSARRPDNSRIFTQSLRTRWPRLR